jgi:uncharacterized integral membrane protein
MMEEAFSSDATPAASSDQPTTPRRRRWLGPVAFLVVIVAPVLILILSNTESVPIGFAGVEREAPLWIILAVTFFAGAVVTRLLIWAWRAFRKRRQPAA